jgi:hypothetical protein
MSSVKTGGEPMPRVYMQAEFVVTSAEILYEGPALTTRAERSCFSLRIG